MTQTTGIINGTDLVAFVGGTQILHSTSFDLNRTQGTRDATTKDSSGWRDLLEATREWSLSGDALFAFDAAYGYDELFELMDTRVSVVVKFSTEVAGDSYYQGSAIITDLSLTASTEENSSFTFTFEGTGVLTKFTGT